MKNYVAVILAAGASSRMGEPKQLLTYDGHTFLQRALSIAKTLFNDRLIVVFGANASAIIEGSDLNETRFVINKDWADGMGSSIREGVRACMISFPAADAIIFITVDQPFLSSSHLAHIISRHEETGKPIVTSTYENTVGIPALFARTYFQALEKLHGDKGAKEIIKGNSDDAVSVEFRGGGVDIDTPAQYQDLVRNKTGS